MKKALLTFAALALLGAPLAAQSVVNPDKGEPSPDRATALGCTAIPDDTYDGTMGSMACITVPGSDVTVTDVSLDISMNHTWVGDLIVKVWSPAGTVTTLMSMPGLAEPADDGASCCGDSSDLVQTAGLNFNDGGTTSAEDMGSTILGTQFVCQDDGLCDYFPVPDSGPGTAGFGDFAGEDANGDWMVCVGDAALGDTGDICSVDLVITGVSNAQPVIEVPTLNYVGLAALLAALGLAGAVFLRRRA